MSIQFRPIREDFGAEVSGVDLSHPLSDQQFQNLLDGFHRFGLLVFKHQSLTPEQQLAFAKRFDHSPTPSSANPSNLPGYPDIHVLSNLVENGKAVGDLHTLGIEWHTDGTYSRTPMIATHLYAIEVPQQGGETLFLSGYGAYERLPENLKSHIESLQASYNLRNLMQEINASNADTPFEREIPDYTDAIHPLVRTHPVTGRKSLWLTWREMNFIMGMTPEQSQRFTLDLLDQVTQPEFVYAHAWEPQDLVVWDNRCLLHSTTHYDYKNERRLLYRIGLEGPAEAA